MSDERRLEIVTMTPLIVDEALRLVRAGYLSTAALTLREFVSALERPDSA